MRRIPARGAFPALLAIALVAGCSSQPAVTPAPAADAAVEASPEPADGGLDAPVPADAGDPDAILGTFGAGGPCPLLSAALAAPGPALLRDSLSFASGEAWSKAALSPGGQRLFDTPNAGGSSFESEVMSFEVLHFCDGAALLKTETEIGYTASDAGNAITDLMVQIGERKLGVSVTRAYKPAPLAWGDADAQALLEKKLQGITESTARVVPADRWSRQILHVFCATKDACDAMERAYGGMASALKADTIVLLTETAGGGFIYCNPDPPLGQECPAK